jgi:diguanylate cyclase (GGDEF)-like protein
VYILIQLFLSSAVVIALFTMFGGTLLQVSDVATSMTRMAHTDALTEIANRRAAMDRLTQEIARAHRYEGAFSVLLLDLDHFKDVNDRHGHEMGDRVLQAFAELVRDACRDADLAARWGGEEFLAILPETDAEDAHAMAMRIREAVAAASFYDVDALTVSIGVATFRPGDTLDDVVGRADRALYIAKEEGRDRVALDPSLLSS